MECVGTNTLAALVAGTLAEGERAAFANHAAACERCHALLEGLMAGDAELALGRGTEVGRYVIEERLGAGGMGVVHAATDTELHRRVAVKLLRPEHHGAGGHERLLREARTLARLSHPNVVTVFDVGVHGGRLFVAMELVDGGSLSSWLRRAPRSTGEIIDRLIEAGQGLAAAHAAGVVHRDVKPDNILVGLDHRARVTDFGLARGGEPPTAADLPTLDAPQSLTRTGALLGTPAYMAPEQLARGEADARTDQWSFCATLYEVVAGVRPFGVEDLADRGAAIREGRLAAPAAGRRVPAWVRRIAARGLRGDPAARWPSMTAVVRALGRGRARRRRLAIGLAAVALAGAAAAAAAVAMQPRDAPPVTVAGQVRAHHKCTGADASACKATCAGRYVLGDPLPGISVGGRQEALLGASLDGNTVLYLAGPQCSVDRLMLGRRRGGTFESVDLTDQIDRTRVWLHESCCTLTGAGDAIVMATKDRTGFVRLRLDGATLSPPVALGRLVANPAQIRSPVLTPDERMLYYRLDDPGTSPGEVGSLDGLLATTRAGVDVPFTAGTRLPRRTQLYTDISGVSEDGLALFAAIDYETYVLVRGDLAQPFGEPGFTVSPSRVRGWRTIPLGGCEKILTTWTPGGCEAEDIVELHRRVP